MDLDNMCRPNCKWIVRVLVWNIMDLKRRCVSQEEVRNSESPSRGRRQWAVKVGRERM